MTILTKAPEGGNVIDLSAARAARAEARALSGETSTFLKLDAGYVEMKAEIALNVIVDFLDNRIKQALGGLLVDPTDVDVLLTDGISTDDFEAILEHLTGKSAGESTASPALY